MVESICTASVRLSLLVHGGLPDESFFRFFGVKNSCRGLTAWITGGWADGHTSQLTNSTRTLAIDSLKSETSNKFAFSL